MIGALAMCVALSVSGTFAALGSAASGPTLTIARAHGVQETYGIRTDALVQERATGEAWERVPLEALKAGEPVCLRVDASGRATEIDAEFARVFVRAVVVDRGFLVGTDGVAHRLIASAGSIAAIPLGAYVALRTDPSTGDAFDADVSTRPFAAAAAEQVAVTFEVRVPPNTPPGSTVYLATNAQSWTANALRLTPEAGGRWTITVNLAPGTVLQYKYTRGSWSTGERDAAGAEIPNRTLAVTGGPVKSQDVLDSVVRWADLPS